MLKIWIQKTRQVMGGNGFRPFHRLRFFSPGIWMVILVMVCVAARFYCTKSDHPAHLQEITAAYGSISLLNTPVQFNHDRSQFIYVATTDRRGVGLFLYDRTTRSKRQIDIEKDGGGYWHDGFDLRAWPWSPDDSSFIYSMRSSLFICPAETNVAAVQLELGTNTFASDIVWLNPLEFVWLERETIGHAKKSANGSWEITRLPHQGRILSLSAIDTHTIAWLQDDFICRLDLSQDLSGTNNPFIPLDAAAYTVPLTNELSLWLDASTLPLTNEAPVRALADLSPQKNSAVVNHNPPFFNAPDSTNALNGKGTIHFESGDTPAEATGLKTSKRLGISGSKARSIFAVMRRDQGRATMRVNLGTAITNGGYFGLCDGNDYLYLPAGGFPGKNDGRMARLPGAWHILEAIYDGTTNRSYVNGALRDLQTLPFNTVNREVELGLRTLNTRSLTNLAAADGDFAELLIYDRDLNFTEQRQVEDYLSAKWFGMRPLSPKVSFVWLDPKLNNLTAFCYSKETRRFLISRSENGQDTLWRLDVKTADEITPVLRGYFLSNVQWTGIREFAYTSREIGHQGLTFADLSGKQNASLFPHANLGWFQVTPDQKQMLFWGNVSNEPVAGIWQYDFATEQLRSVIGGSEHPSSRARSITAYNGLIKLPSGRSVVCTVYPPANFDRRKKYPLVLGDTLISDPIYGQWLQSGIAACGAYVVFVNRKSWGEEIDHWEENVLGLYDFLKSDPCIDTRRIYLFGASAETQYLRNLAADHPGLWRGLILLNPSTLPDFSKSSWWQSRPKILISAGGEEHEEERFQKYEQNALPWGVLVQTIIHPGETHRMVGTAAKQVRLKAIEHFIFEE